MEGPYVAPWKKRRNNPTGHTLVQAVRQSPPPNPKPEDLESYHPFVSEGYVSLSEGGNTGAVKILHDTGATQSLIASHVLPFSGQTSADASVLYSPGSWNGHHESTTSSDTS